MSEDENIAQELGGHLTQVLRTSLAGGLQLTEQRARRAQHDAETERRRATDAARQLEDRKRAERESNALLAQQAMVRQEQERADQTRQAAAEVLDAADDGVIGSPLVPADFLGPEVHFHRATAAEAAEPGLIGALIEQHEAERAEQARRAAVEAASTAYPTPVGEALAGTRDSASERTAKTCHQRDRGASLAAADLGR